MKTIKLIAVTGLIFFTLNLQAQNKSYCEQENPYVTKKVNIQDEPNYFFRTFPNSNKVSYASSEGSNRILDLDTGNSVAIPGIYDPVPTWDEQIMTVPNPGTGTMEFYSVKDLLAKKPAAQAQLPAGNNLEGVYQSIGNLSADSSGTKVRIVTDHNGATYQDYKVSKDAQGRPVVKEVGQPVTLCPGRDIKLPMLSKGGGYLAARDMKMSPPTTKIFKIKPNGECVLWRDLKVNTGKVDFSFDGKSLTFHMEEDGEDNVDYFETSQTRQNVFVYDLTTNKMKRMTHNLGGASYYPVWRADGKLVYINRDKNDNYSFVVADPNRVASNTSATTFCGAQQVTAFEALAATWQRACNAGSYDNKAVLKIIAGMSNAQCVKMVNDNWGTMWGLESFRNTWVGDWLHDSAGFNTKQDLINACPKPRQTTAPRTQPRVQTTPPVQAGPTGKEIFKQKCQLCHGTALDNMSKRPTSSSSKKATMKEEILSRLNSHDESYKMPRGSAVNQRDMTELTRYINGLR